MDLLRSYIVNPALLWRQAASSTANMENKMREETEQFWEKPNDKQTLYLLRR